MSGKSKKLCNPFSTGGGGAHFEAHVQASFVTLMLTGGHAPCLPCWPIKEIKLQGKIDGFDTDDVIVFVENEGSKERRKLLGQIKHSIAITESSAIFGEVIQATWNDYNSTKFIKGKDAIALITGPLSATDTTSVLWLTNHARRTSSDDFFRNIETANFSSKTKREKLKVFRHHLKSANGDVDVDNSVVHDFLKNFYYLGYDLGEEEGVVLSLINSHITQFNPKEPKNIWGRIVEFVQTTNQHGGSLTLSDFPDDLIAVFKQPVITSIPKELTIVRQDPEETDWSRHPHATDLVLASLVGSWNEKYETDTAVVAELLSSDYAAWAKNAREILHSPDSPLSQKNGHWKFPDRVDLWSPLGSRIFDQHLESFKEIAVKVLSERDPSFDLPVDERYAASIHGKELSHSLDLRKGLAEGLATLGNNPQLFSNCSPGKADATTVLAIREFFEEADWVVWGSLNDLLPALAEAAPGEFLSAVEAALKLEPCPFDQLFAQEGNGVTGRNYLTGLLWALEGLAWDENYLVRVCVVLGELASHDPGGQWANRPINSIATTLLPWFPQTLAPIGKRKVAVKTLNREWPDIGWQLLIQLLPNSHQTSTGTYKPVWRKIVPEGWKEDVSPKDYQEQVAFYAELAIASAGYDLDKLAELVDHFDNLPKPAFDLLLGVLSSDAISGLPEDQRLPIWDHLTKFTVKHRKFSEAKWALPDELVTSIETVADRLAPTNPFNLYQHLFSDRDHDLYDENGNWEEQRQKLEKRRETAIEEIFQQGGIDAIIQFAKSVLSPSQVGYSLACLADTSIEQTLLPTFLDSEDSKYTMLISGFVWRRYYLNGWAWPDEIDKSSWSTKQIACFLSYLPFTKESWERASQWLGESQGEFWIRTGANAYQADEDLDIAIEKLIECGRPHAAMLCLDRMHHAKQQIDAKQCVQALMAGLSSEESPQHMDQYRIAELIKLLQEDPTVSQDDLFKVEWAYLALLDRHRGAAPKLLESRLASNPEFFCEVLRLIYRSTKEDEPLKEPTENSEAIATNAWSLLREWRTPPGTQGDGGFSEADFSDWLQKVKDLCSESGHLEVALIAVGEVLIHSPSDPGGLWIHKTIAGALNDRNAEDMRRGYRTGTFNARGVYTVDPTGKTEKELAEHFRQKAEGVETAGFYRFAITLKELADSYVREAERVISEYKLEDSE